MSAPLRIKACLGAVAFCLLLPSSVANTQNVTQQEVKASYILKILPFIGFAESTGAIQSICYYEKAGTSFNESVGQIIGKYVTQSPEFATQRIVVKRFEAIRDLTGCDVFYIPEAEGNSIDSILSALGSTPTLTISSAPRFILRGGMFGFVLDDQNRIKIEANMRNLRKKGIKVDARLLEIMARVIED